MGLDWRRPTKSESFFIHVYDNLNNTEPDERRVEAVALFHPLAEPSKRVRWGLPSPDVREDKRAPSKDEDKGTAP